MNQRLDLSERLPRTCTESVRRHDVPLHRMQWASLVLGILGNVATVSWRGLAPMPTFWRILKKRSTESFSADPYTIGLLNVASWLYYGLIAPHLLPIVIVCGISTIFQMVYVGIYLFFASHKQRVIVARHLVLSLLLFGCTLIITLHLCHGTIRIKVVGLICSMLAIISYASPLTIMGQVIKTRSVEFMPLHLSLLLLLVGGIWFTYSIVIQDLFLGVPNGIGFLLGVVQLVLYAIYWKHERKVENCNMNLKNISIPNSQNNTCEKCHTPSNVESKCNDLLTRDTLVNV